MSALRPRVVPILRSEFEHTALFYADDAEFLDATLGFIRGGLEAGEPALVMIEETKAQRLREELGAEDDLVQFADIREVGANPAWLIPSWHKFLNRHDGLQRLRGISEPVWPERTAAELVECHVHESLVNVAFAGAGPFALLCLYDARSLDAEVLDDALCCHPRVRDARGERASGAYRNDDAQTRFAVPFPPAPEAAQTMEFNASKLRALRAFVTWQASAAGLRGHRLDDLVLASHEIASNSIRHGQGSGVLRLWAEGQTVICEARDRGRLDSLLAGRQMPAPDQIEGRGLWLANQLCDLVQIRSSPDGTTVRLHVHGDRR